MSRAWSLDQLATRTLQHLSVVLPGESAEIPFTVIVGQSRSPVCLVLAGVHGDEFEGPAAVHDLCAEIHPQTVRGVIVFVPVANPAAFHAAARRHPGDNGDLNRAFPGNPAGGPTERLAHVLMQEFILRADCILSLHGWSKEASVLPYAEYPDGASEAARRSMDAAQALGFRYLHPYVWPAGVLGDASLRHGIPTVECEIGGMGTTTAEGRAQDRDVILRFLAHFKLLDARLAPAPKPLSIGHTDVHAGHAGLFRSAAALGDRVEPGATLGFISSLAGERIEEVRASAGGTVGLLRTLASVQPGDLMAQVFREVEES